MLDVVIADLSRLEKSFDNGKILKDGVKTAIIGTPSTVTNSSIVSLVVPSISVTIALSSFKIQFKSDDFPAFGFK